MTFDAHFLQLPGADVFGHLKDFNNPQTVAAVLIIVLLLGFLIFRLVFGGKSEDRRDALSLALRSRDEEKQRADDSEAETTRLREKVDEIQQLLNGYAYIFERPTLLRDRADELEELKREKPAIISEGHILIVEDHEDTREMMLRHLAQWGYDVKSAESAAKAREQCLLAQAQEPFDLILLDEMMPDESGQGFLRRLRSEGDTTPAVFLTAYPGAINPDEVRQLGILAVWPKGMTSLKLRRSLEDVLK